MSQYGRWCSNSDVIAATVALNASASAELDMRGLTPLALELPAAFTATSAYIAFKVGFTTGAAQYLRDKDGTMYTVSIADTNTNLRPYLSPTVFAAGWPYVQLVVLAADKATAVVQGAARSINVIGGKVV